MKYSNEIEINLPRQKVIELFDSFDNMKHWQQGFISHEHISGTPGQVGAKAKLKYKNGKREIALIETITKRNLPDEFAGTYEMNGVWNLVDNKFIEVSSSETKWISYCEFRLSGFMMRLIAFLMP